MPNPGTQTLRPNGTNCAKLGYAEYVPANYADQATWPLIIFFHGNGEIGNGTTELNKLLNAGLPRAINLNKWDAKHRFIVLSPQTWGNGRTLENVENFIGFAKANYKVDATRIYLSGLSGGGEAIFTYLLKRAGGEVAAALPIAGWNPYSFTDNGGAECTYKHVPIWFFHGSVDGTVTPNTSQITFDRLKACKPAPAVAPRYTLYTGVGHDAWTRTYELTGMNNTVEPGYTPYDQSMYDWLLQYSR